MTTDRDIDTLAKVPSLTLGFWVVKVLATTLGETGGDAMSMSLGLGYLAASAIFFVAFVVAVGVQIRSRAFHPAIYWSAIIASTTVGTTLADFATRSLGIGYLGGSVLLAALLLLALLSWHRSTGRIDVGSVATPKVEAFYWATIMASQTLGTALGDWTADTAGLGYLGAAGVFGALLLAVVGLHAFTRASRTALFWAAFVLTRPLGAVVGDFLDKPVSDGGLELSRYAASAVLLGLVAVLIWRLPQRAAERAH